MEKRWFVFMDQVVRGPLSTEEIDQGLTAGHWTLETLIWWKGQTEWIPISNWRVRLSQLVAEIEEKKMAKEWFAEVKGVQSGPMTRSDLVVFLRKAPNPFQFSLWSPGMSDCKKLFFFEEILSEMGISRRNYSRAPLEGSVELVRREHKFTLEATDISPAGIGVVRAQGLMPGYSVQIAIRSTVFPNPIHSNAHVLYVKPNGHAGVKFDNMHIEAKSAIVEYVRQFEDSENKIPKPPIPLVKKSAA